MSLKDTIKTNWFSIFLIVLIFVGICLIIFLPSPHEDAEIKAPLVCDPYQVKNIYKDHSKYMVVCASIDGGVEVKEIK